MRRMLWLGVTITWGTVLRGHNSMKIDNHRLQLRSVFFILLLLAASIFLLFYFLIFVQMYFIYFHVSLFLICCFYSFFRSNLILIWYLFLYEIMVYFTSFSLRTNQVSSCKFLLVIFSLCLSPFSY